MQRATHGPKKVDPSDLEAVYGLIQKGAQKAIRKYSPLQREHEAGDVANEYFAHYVEKGFDKKYDPNQGVPLGAWIGLGLQRWCIDRLRSKKLQFQPKGSEETVFRVISADQPTDGEDGATLMEILAQTRESAEDPLTSMIITEAMSNLDPETRKVVEYRMKDHTLKEIAHILDTSEYRVSKRLAFARDELEYML